MLASRPTVSSAASPLNDHTGRKPAGGRLDGEHRRRRGGRSPRPLGDPGDRRLAAAVTVGAADLDPQRTLQSLRREGS